MHSIKGVILTVFKCPVVLSVIYSHRCDDLPCEIQKGKLGYALNTVLFRDDH